MTIASRTAHTISALALLVTAALSAASIAAAEPTDPGTWPVAQGNFTTPGEPGWVFFKPQGFGGSGCGIGPDGTVGCDIVPARWPDGSPVQEGQPGPSGFYSCEGRRCPLPPPATNQTVAGPEQPAQYVQSGTLTFTRDVDVLPTGFRLVNGNASCRLSEQATLSCATGENGFILNATYGILESPAQR